jgi:hypothetical protein
MPKRTLKRSMLATLGALLLALAASASAGAAWNSPVGIAGSALKPVEEPPAVAVDDQGDATFAWVGADGRVQTRTRSAAGSLSGIQTLSAGGTTVLEASAVDVAVDDDGDAVFSWVTVNTAGSPIIAARARSRTGTLSARQTVATVPDAPEPELWAVDYGAPEVAVDADGDAIVVWSQDGVNKTISKARARTRAGALRPVQTISNNTEGASALFAKVEMAPGGDAVFAWEQTTATVTSQIQTRTRTATGTLGQIRALSGPEAALPQLAVADNGGAVFAWQRKGPAVTQIEARARSAAGALSPVQALSSATHNAAEPRVAVDADGDAAFAWEAPDATTGKFRIHGRTRSSAGALGTVRLLSDASADAHDGQVGMAADGTAVFAWRRNPGTGDVVESRTLSPAGTLGAVQDVGTGPEPLSLRLAVGDNSKAVAAWLDPNVKRIVAAVGP